jgi:hypothetical protein
MVKNGAFLTKGERQTQQKSIARKKEKLQGKAGKEKGT